MTVISYMSNITGLIVSIHYATSWIKIPITPVSTAEDMQIRSFQSYELHLETLIVSVQRYILTWGYAITYESHRYV